MKTKKMVHGLKWVSVIVLLLTFIAAPLPSVSAPPTDDPSPQAALEALQGRLGTPLDVDYSETTGILYFLAGDLTPAQQEADPVEVALKFLTENGAVFGMRDASAELALLRHTLDSAGADHVRFAQTVNGVPVFGRQVIVHLKNGAVKTINGDFIPGLSLDTRASLSQEDALEAMRADLGASDLQVGEGTPQLVVYPSDGDHTLAWHVQGFTPEPLGDWAYFVNAQTGDIVDHYNTLDTARVLRTYDANHGTRLPGTLTCSANNGTCSGGDASERAAHLNARHVYDYYALNFGRDSYDGAGRTIRSSVHYLTNYNNAFWSSSLDQMVFGDGDGTIFGPLPLAYDVTAHELTHAVTSYAVPPNGLIYLGESGAINEGVSDVFAAVSGLYNGRDADWQIAEEVYTPGTPGDALRDLRQPLNYSQPRHKDQKLYLPSRIDNGGIHVNSGIYNVIAYGIAQNIGAAKTQQIYYSALANYYTPSTNFSQARNLTSAACDNLVGSHSITSNDCQLVRRQWARAGYNSPTGLNYPVKTTVQNPGFERGRFPWVYTGALITNQSGVPKHRGSYAAWFGGYDGAYDEMVQSLQVPNDGACQARVIIWLQVQSSEGFGQPYDFFHLDLQRASDGGTIRRLYTASDETARDAWIRAVRTRNLCNYAGQRIRLRLLATNDDCPLNCYPTNFFVDDVLVSWQTPTLALEADEPIREEPASPGPKEAPSDSANFIGKPRPE